MALTGLAFPPEKQVVPESMFDVWSVFQVLRWLDNLWPQVEEVARAAA